MFVLLIILRFLRVDNVVGGPQMWKELLQPYNATDFAAFFKKYSIRFIIHSWVIVIITEKLT